MGAAIEFIAMGGIFGLVELVLVLALFGTALKIDRLVRRLAVGVGSQSPKRKATCRDRQAAVTGRLDRRAPRGAVPTRFARHTFYRSLTVPDGGSLTMAKRVGRNLGGTAQPTWPFVATITAALRSVQLKPD
jgi:hypothetical protein